ncbi:phosphoenolpyruvate carboxykinase (ATP) [Cohaesibacter sp. ES.047]|uniref:phosphoenolpyruvate carboxykinase n=1 Tax=Cohaesibacter sp. ES.047 TaxID=1798205 RepID=UPI000BB6B272|nr:phosphoenolpyruvate carboxykinase [Cohaesibacter sp. ES.047]SNY90153.1 phosphoenolpyruvate carboxykinase (ATP) [Cohaesibacter sp. ES.047]
MKQFGTINESYGVDKNGLRNLEAVHWNYRYPKLVEEALARGEGRLIHGGAFAVDTGVHTGRSPKDKFTVRDDVSENTIWWDNNKAMTPESFDLLFEDMMAYAEGKELFVQDLYGGADIDHRLPTRVVTELAWQSHFIRNMLIRPEHEELASFMPELTVIDLPSFECDPEKYGIRSSTCIALNLKKKIILVAGSSYAGEIKKSVFTTLNYLLPEKGIMPMHCSANVDDEGNTAIFFGLSGTGKTTLSADPNRTLIGDDEHGWGENGVFNFEGGCYAKTIRLSAEAEPEIFATTHTFGAIVENMVIDPITDIPDFEDGSKTENTRVSYPIDFIPNASLTGRAPQPKNIIMLTADAFGVLPPIAKLTPEQAMYHFLSGYTAKVAGTEKGVTEPEATFSTCFGAPFMPRHPSEYGNLLREMMEKHQVTCWLVNTGWTGGAYGVGSRMPIKATRALLTAALNGSLSDMEFRTNEIFGIQVPLSCPGVDDKLLMPRDTWADKDAFDAQAKKLAGMFVKNFEYYLPHVDEAVKAAAPKA